MLRLPSGIWLKEWCIEMAKKDQKEEEIILPELDEREFLEKEIQKGKSVVISYALGIAVGFISAFLQFIGLLPVAAILGIAFAFLIPYLFSYIGVKVDRKSLTYDLIAFLLAWITFWIVGLNPPFF